MDLSIVIPAYNESTRIRSTLDAVADYFSGAGASFEIIVVDDGSEDGTAGEVERWRDSRVGAAGAVRVASIAHQGKGAAVAAGVAAAAGGMVLMSDADLSTPITEWPKFAKELADGAKVVIGSRQAEGAKIELRQPWLRQRLGLLFGRLARALFPMGVVDSQCGFKAFESAAAKDLFGALQTSGFCFDVELLLLARSRGIGISEVPVRWINHPDSKVRVWRDWPRVLYELWRIRRDLGRAGDGSR